MSPPLSEQAIDRDCAPLSRGRQDFAGVCGRLHFFYCRRTTAPPGSRKSSPQEKKSPLADH